MDDYVVDIIIMQYHIFWDSCKNNVMKKTLVG